MSFSLYCVGDFNRLKKGVTIYFSGGTILGEGAEFVCIERTYFIRTAARLSTAAKSFWLVN